MNVQRCTIAWCSVAEADASADAPAAALADGMFSVTSKVEEQQHRRKFKDAMNSRRCV